jgi:hypothetical protein
MPGARTVHLNSASDGDYIRNYADRLRQS